MTRSCARFTDPDSRNQAAAHTLAAWLRAACEENGWCSLVLAGGRTPAGTYRLIAEAAAIDWEKVHVFWGDERCVPPDDPESNFDMARRCLLKHVPVPPGNVHPIETVQAPVDAARAYERCIRAFFKGKGEDRPIPSFDVVLLGIGADGHTASLFPGDPVLAEMNRLAAAVTAPAGTPVLERVTLTLPVLCAARQVCFLAGGLDKLHLIEAVASAAPAAAHLPAARVSARREVCWFVSET